MVPNDTNPGPSLITASGTIQRRIGESSESTSGAPPGYIPAPTSMTPAPFQYNPPAMSSQSQPTLTTLTTLTTPAPLVTPASKQDPVVQQPPAQSAPPPPQQQQQQQPSQACPDRCKTAIWNGGPCPMYVSSWGVCGQNKLQIDGVEYGWGDNYVERYGATDCRGCSTAATTPIGAPQAPSVQAPSAPSPSSQQASAAQPSTVTQPSGEKYCDGDVCVKRPPNCFGAKSGADEQCMNCRQAQEAYRQRGWRWLGDEPDAALFCKKWP